MRGLYDWFLDLYVWAVIVAIIGYAVCGLTTFLHNSPYLLVSIAILLILVWSRKKIL